MSIILCKTSGRLLVPVENHDCICAAFCICGFVCKCLHTRLIQSIRVLSERDYVSLTDCYSISATTSIFHFLEQCGGLVFSLNTIFVCIMIEL